MPALTKKKFGTQIDPTLHQRLKVLAALTGRRIDSLVEEAIRNLTAGAPQGNFVTFEQMHAAYERQHGIKINIAAEARKIQARRAGRRLKRG